MAFYSSSYFMDDHGEFHSDYPLNSYCNNFQSVLVQESAPYSSYISNDYQNYVYNSTPFFADYNHPVSSYSRIGNSVSNYCEPLHIEFKPATHYSAQTRFIISYSVSESNDDTDFEEYDPTPYGGGYDQILTYGKPLPPSDETCYPRSSPLNGISSGEPVAKEVVDEPAAKPEAESKPTPAEDAEQPQQQLDKPLEPDQEGESKESYGDNRGPWSGYDNGLGGRDGHEYEKQAAHVPPGYGLEAIDLCESLFGYWPCLSRQQKTWQDCQSTTPDCGNYSHQWKSTADYLFGSPNPYGETRDEYNRGSYGNAVYDYGYQSLYYQQQPLYHQIDDF